MKKIISFVCLLALTLSCLFVFTSCGGPNSDPDKALAALKENGISWASKDSTIKPATLKLLGVDGVDCVVTGTGKIDEKYAHITIIYFYESAQADDAWEKIQEESDKEKEDDEDGSDWVCKKSGKMIYYGTKSAVDAAK